MTIRDFFAGFSLDIANVTICTENYDTLVCGTVHFDSQSDYRLEELDKIGDRLIKSWFVNLHGELFITIF